MADKDFKTKGVRGTLHDKDNHSAETHLNEFTVFQDVKDSTLDDKAYQALPVSSGEDEAIATNPLMAIRNQDVLEAPPGEIFTKNSVAKSNEIDISGYPHTPPNTEATLETSVRLKPLSPLSLASAVGGENSGTDTASFLGQFTQGGFAQAPDVIAIDAVNEPAQGDTLQAFGAGNAASLIFPVENDAVNSDAPSDDSDNQNNGDGTGDGTGGGDNNTGDDGNNDDTTSDDGNNGHGNDPDGVDDSNPGQGNGNGPTGNNGNGNSNNGNNGNGNNDDTTSDDGNNGHGNDPGGVDDSNPGQGNGNGPSGNNGNGNGPTGNNGNGNGNNGNNGNGNNDDTTSDDGNNGHGNDPGGVDDSNPGQGNGNGPSGNNGNGNGNGNNGNGNNDDSTSDDGNNGHGNDPDGVDDSNPGQGNGNGPSGNNGNGNGNNGNNGNGHNNTDSIAAEDSNNGHGNDVDGDDESNPGQSTGVPSHTSVAGVTLNGGNGKDTLVGTDGNDVINGGNGKDDLTGGKGDDILDGGNGVDTAHYSGKFADYHISSNSDGSYTITDSVAGRDGSDRVSNIEFFQFNDSLQDASSQSWLAAVDHSVSSSSGGVSALASVQSSSWLESVEVSSKDENSKSSSHSNHEAQDDPSSPAHIAVDLSDLTPDPSTQNHEVAGGLV